MNELTRRGLIFGAAALAAAGVFAGVNHIASKAFVEDEPASPPEATVEIVEFDDNGKRTGKVALRKVLKTKEEWRRSSDCATICCDQAGRHGNSGYGRFAERTPRGNFSVRGLRHSDF